MARFLHVSLNFEDGKSKIDELVPSFNQSLDWLRYAPNCWIIYTNENPEAWAHRLRDVVNAKDTIFVSEFNPATAYGYMPQTCWDWFKKPR